MTLERARILAQPKPWGVAELRPWNREGDGATLIGELSYERSSATGSPPQLLLKLLLTSEPLSIQVHPNDTYARSIGLPNGKSEAWYVLSAAPDAKVALGLKAPVSRQQLRSAIDDGSIVNLVDWQPVRARDAITVPAGTIHAIGAGVVIVEIQQRNGATFRLFDHGRARALHVDDAIASTDCESRPTQTCCKQLSPERTLLASNEHFVFERIELDPGSTWRLDAERETWLIVLNGIVETRAYCLDRGDAIFGQGEQIDFKVGRIGAECLVAYTGNNGPLPELLQRIEHWKTTNCRRVGNGQPWSSSFGIDQ